MQKSQTKPSIAWLLPRRTRADYSEQPWKGWDYRRGQLADCYGSRERSPTSRKKKRLAREPSQKH
jgi:hypothetical protein